MFEFINYESNKTDLLAKMNNVKTMLSQLSEFDIDVSDAIDKIEIVEKGILSDTFSIVLVGAFSDGKTSVIAGWLNEKVDNMKIDTDESSDEILRYSPASLPKGCQIVDTPGLFGDKVGDDNKGEKVVLSEITKNFISEANVILYVVPAKNPIKDSHKSCIRWILNDLNKLSSVIFVINKMDDIVDLTDVEEFESQKKIKTDYLKTRLLECGIDQNDVENVNVVCVSAAPGGKDIEFWKDNRDKYLERSHMTSLEDAVHDILKNSREFLITKTGCDVLNDEINKALNEVYRQEKALDEIILPEMKESLKRNKKDLDQLRKRIRQNRDDLKNDLKSLNKSKVSKIRAASMETLNDILEEEIGLVPGKEGMVLSEDITAVYSKYAEKYRDWALDVGDKFQKEYQKRNATIENVLKMGLTGVSVGLKGAAKIGVETFKQAIFAGRDLLGKLGIVIKFKPWQVVKMAKFTAKALPVIGAAIDVISNIAGNITAASRNRKFEKTKDDVKNSINEVFLDSIEQLKDDDWFFENVAPGVKELEKQIEMDEECIEKLEMEKNQYIAWSKKMNNMEFSVY